MKNSKLKEIGILALVGLGIGLIFCLFSGEFRVSTLLITTFGILIISVLGDEDSKGHVSSPYGNSMTYNTDLGTGKLITELQKLNASKTKHETSKYVRSEDTPHITDSDIESIMSELQKLSKNNQNR